MKKLFFKRTLLPVILILLAVLFCSGCQMSQQERNGVSLLPHNRPTMNSMRNPAMGGVGFRY